LNQATSITSPRDLFLDCLKGFAIITVVLGHTFQGATADFDNYLPFRLVYSFHMPMFMFVAGMTASLGLSRRLGTALSLPSYVSEIRSKALRLVVPFITWAIIQYYVTHPQGYNPQTWLLHVLQYPDNGLWFLWILFQCSCIFVLVTITVHLAFRVLAGDRNNNPAILYILLLVAGFMAGNLLSSLPDNSSTFLTKIYFMYFFTGALFHIVWPNGLPNTIRWTPYVIFLALAPFWYRIEISPVALLFPKPGPIDSEYRMIVAFAGTLAFVDLVRLFVARATTSLTQMMAFVGKRSLDIYAIHFYFLGYFPPVLAPLAISLGGSFLLRTNFLTSWLCFGQRPSGFKRLRQHRLLSGAPQVDLKPAQKTSA
jgi:fucose 4-O-acetylase-like acetyltransferase